MWGFLQDFRLKKTDASALVIFNIYIFYTISESLASLVYVENIFGGFYWMKVGDFFLVRVNTCSKNQRTYNFPNLFASGFIF